MDFALAASAPHPYISPISPPKSFPKTHCMFLSAKYVFWVKKNERNLPLKSQAKSVTCS